MKQTQPGHRLDSGTSSNVLQDLFDLRVSTVTGTKQVQKKQRTVPDTKQPISRDCKKTRLICDH